MLEKHNNITGQYKAVLCFKDANVALCPAWLHRAMGAMVTQCGSVTCSVRVSGQFLVKRKHGES